MPKLVRVFVWKTIAKQRVRSFMYGVNRAAGAVCGGRSRVEKIWRVESGEGERESFGYFLGFLK
ncbi:hypothetical protein ACE6H2_014954 [Prunus campanulata]